MRLVCSCGLFLLAPVLADLNDLQRPLADDKLGHLVPPPPLPKWKLRNNRMSLSAISCEVRRLFAENFTLFYGELSEDSGRTAQCGFDHIELTFETVLNELQEVPERELRGEVVKIGDLGRFILNHLPWTDDWLQMPIGTGNVSDHRLTRPIFNYVMGRDSVVWNHEFIRASAEQFFKDRKTINKEDINSWVDQLFHKIFLDIVMTDQDAADFQHFKMDLLKVAVLPTWLASAFRWFVGLSSVRERRNHYVGKYMKAIGRMYPQFELAGRDLRLVADLFLASFTLAGGISVPTAIHNVLALVHGAAPANLEGSDRVLTEKNLEQFVFETLRLFPLVQGFAYWNPSLTSRTVLAIGQANRDPEVWDEPLTFKLRGGEYHQIAGAGTKIGISWAEQAKGYYGLTPDSRGCPAKDLSMVVITEFLKVYMIGQEEWSALYKEEGGIFINDHSMANNFTIHRVAAPP